MNRMFSRAGALALTSALCLITVGRLSAQTTAAPATPPASREANDEVIELSPFVVDSKSDEDGYRANSTLGGSRVRTDLKDLASSLSVVTTQFLRDTGAVNNQTLLTYVTNTEVGGTGGNFSGLGNTMVNGIGENLNTLVRPQQNTRVRGLDSADNTRDYYLSDIPWDGYNVDRVEIQRGPNSILFGFGSPAGIVNTSLIQAGFKSGGKIENRIGGYGSIRWSLDDNQVLLKKQLSFRIAAVDDNTKYRQKPAFNHAQRIYGAVRFDPEILNQGSAHTTIRGNYERGRVASNNPRSLPPLDKITPFFTNMNKQTFDPYYATANQMVGSSTSANANENPWLAGYMLPSLQGTYNPVLVYNWNSTSPTQTAFEPTISTKFGLNGKNDPANSLIPGKIDEKIEGIPFMRPLGVASYSEWAKNTDQHGASRGYYKDNTLSDPAIFDFFNNLIDGPTKREWQRWEAYNLTIDQTFLDGRLAFQLAYDHQNYKDGYSRNLGWAPYIGVDLNTTMGDYPAYAYPTLAVANPNVGRAVIGSSTQNQGYEHITKRDYYRLMGTGEFRAEDVMDKGSFLANLIGRHNLTALFSSETQKDRTSNWAPYQLDTDYTAALGLSSLQRISDGNRSPDLVYYISDGNLANSSLAAGLNLHAISAVQNPSGLTKVKYFDSHWNAAPSVGFGDAWIDPAIILSASVTSNASIQSENPLNYVGWKTDTFNMLNAANGDINQTYSDISKTKRDIKSASFIWQGHMLDDVIVPTVGWRRDTVTMNSSDANTDAITGAASLSDFRDNPEDKQSGTTTSWGFVVHTPKNLRQKLPGNTDIMFGFNNGNNTRVQNRYSFTGDPLPLAKGHTREYSLGFSTLNDRVTFKATWYDTKVKDADISSGGGENGTLGSNTYYLYLLNGWGLASALTDKAGLAGLAPGYASYWAWAWPDNGWDWDTYTNPTNPLFLNSASTKSEIAAVNDFLKKMPAQSFWDAYGFNVNVAKAQSPDAATAITGIGGGWTPGVIGGVQAAGKGRIKGVYPQGTINTESKGLEFELTAQLRKNWSLTVNASKTKAVRQDLNADFAAFIIAEHDKWAGPAGDLRLWWAGDSKIGTYFLQNIWAPYQFQQDAKGNQVPEMAPWRFNVVTNYSFDHGMLKGANVGLGYRWQDGEILGYGLTSYVDVDKVTQYKLDVAKPFWGKSQDAVDLWAGYGHKLTSKIDWRIQLNLRAVGQKVGLVPISVQPDGSTAQSRIRDGMSWQLTNTFSF